MYRKNHCRVCNHNHCYLVPSTTKFDYDIGECLYFCSGHCKCTGYDFITLDNLELLELEYENDWLCKCKHSKEEHTIRSTEYDGWRKEYALWKKTLWKSK